jgi:asparagine synthase (glutamine-hydrolysing)
LDLQIEYYIDMKVRFFCGFIPIGGSNCKNLVAPVPAGCDRISNNINVWISRNWHESEIIFIQDGKNYLIVIGRYLEDFSTVYNFFQDFTYEDRNLEVLLNQPGSFNVIVNKDDVTRLYTDLSGIRPLYYTVQGSYIYFSSFSILIKELIRAKINPTWFASSLILDSMPQLIEDISPFRNILSVPPGKYIEISPDSFVCQRYFNVPKDTLNLAEGATELNFNLRKSVELRVNKFYRISSDLSGGLDSSGLTILASNSLAKLNLSLNAITFKNISDYFDEDFQLANLIASSFKNINHLKLDQNEFSSSKFDLDDVPMIDEPSEVFSLIGRYQILLNSIYSTNSLLHLSGEGGDDALSAPLSYLVTLARRGKFYTLLSHIYGYSRLYHLSLVDLLFSVLDKSLINYNTWIDKIIYMIKNMHKDCSANSQYIQKIDGISWSCYPSFQSWYTQEAFNLATSELQKHRNYITHTNSLSQFSAITNIHYLGRFCRTIQQIGELISVTIDFPYLDGNVVKACLQTKVEERTSPYQYKPLLKCALQRELPDYILSRSSKGDYTSDRINDIVANLDFIHTIFQDSYLERINLIDSFKFINSVEQLSAGKTDHLREICHTLNNEIWLQRIMNHENIFFN